MSDILDRLAEDNTKKDPFIILMGLYLVASSNQPLDDEHYFRWIRLRKLITLDMLQTKKFYDILVNVFSQGCAYKFVKLLEEVELLEMIFPSIYALIKIDGGHYHNETVYSHVMGALRALDKLNLPWYVKLSALYHDCGKQKWEISPEGKRRFTNHAAFGEHLVECDLRRLKFPEGIISIAKTLVLYHMSHMNDQDEIHVHSLRKVKTKFDEMKIPFKYFFWIRYADNMGSAVKQTNFMYYWRIYKLSLKALNPPHIPSVIDLEINGHDLIKSFNNIEGKCIGYILKTLFNLWQENKIENNYDTLLAEAKRIKGEYENEFTKKHKD